MRFGFHRGDDNVDSLSFRFSGVNLYLALTSLLFLLVLVAYLLVRFTNFAGWIGRPSQGSTPEVELLQTRVNQLQQRLDVQSNYLKSMSQDATDTDLDTLEVAQDLTSGPSATYATRIALDDTLRKRVLKSNMTLPIRTPFILNVTEKSNLEDEFLIPPIRGVVRKSFSLAEGHFGVDIIAPENSAVKSTLDGLVIESDWTLEGGNSIMVQHENNLISIYKHNSALLKKKGDYVKTGEAIAIIGNTGLHSAGPHVHFELWHQGEPLNPEVYISLESEKNIEANN